MCQSCMVIQYNVVQTVYMQGFRSRTAFSSTGQRVDPKV